MCDDCTRQREAIKADLLAALQGDEDSRLVQAIENHVPDALEQVNRRIDDAISAGRIPEDRRPSDEEVEEAVRDCLLAAVLGTGAASLAAATPGYTDEGKMPLSVILGSWAGSVFSNELEDEVKSQQDMLRHLLGMGDN